MDATLTTQSFIRDFKNEVVRWRSGAATAWSLIFLLPLTFVFFFLSTLSVFSPFQSLLECLFRIWTLEFWMVMVLLFFMVLLSARLNAHHYRVSSYFPRTRLRKIINSMHPRRLLFVIGQAGITGAAAWCAARLTGGRFKPLSYTCPHDVQKQCLNESHVFIVLFGCINGIILAVTFFTSGKYVLRFPAVTQRKLFEVKGQFGDLLTNAALHAFKYLKYYCIGYYFLSERIVKTAVMANFNLEYDRNTTSVDTVRGMLDMSLLFHAWFIVTFAILAVSLSHLLHCAYILQPYEFPIEPPYDSVRDLCLHHAISCEGYPLLQYLASLDLARLSKYSVSRRQQLFSLTSISLQPDNWNQLRSVCLTELHKFIQSLTAYCGPSGLNGSAAGSVVKPGLGNRFTGTGPTTSSHEQNNATSTISSNNSLLNSLKAALCRRPLIAYFINETPEMVSRSIFADAQKYIFIVDGLSRVVCASYKEDVFGVVQPSLPTVVSTLLDMLDAVDRHLKLCPIVLRRPRGAGSNNAIGDHLDIALRFALKTSIKCAIYRLMVTFQHHLDSIELTPEHKKRLQLFEDFKE